MSSAKSLTPRQEDRRYRILSAAREMVADHGYEGMVMSQVAERAEVSPTTLYNLYNTKDELLLEALRELLVENYRRVGELSDGPGWKYLLGVVEFGASLRTNQPAYSAAIIDALLRAAPGDALTVLLLNEIQQDFYASTRVMAKRGQIKEGVDVELLSMLLVGNYWSTFLLLNKGLCDLDRLRHTLEVNLLATLVEACQGETREELESMLQERRQKGP